MLSTKNLLRSRIPGLRPLRPPNKFISTSQPQRFRQNRQLLLIAQRTSRPQLPYLSQPAFSSRDQVLLTGPSQQIARLLSTETKEYVSEQLVLATKYCAVITVFFVLGVTAWVGIEAEKLERKNPTPDEWSYGARWYLREARYYSGAYEKRGVVNWEKLSGLYHEALKKLENLEKDGKGLEEQADGGLLIPDVGKAGYDISSKSWPWRSGYFEVIMGCAAAAEHLEDKVRDTTRDAIFWREQMIGPSNLDPRPVPYDAGPPPLEKNCERALPPPETFYMRVLTGRGFTTKQKLEAAFAYANWLEYKNLYESAEEMYRWGVDIAKAGLEVDPAMVIDDKSGILKADNASAVTPNLLRATTNLAIHQARSGNVSSALPMLLSVLRARRTSPVSPFPLAESTGPVQEESSTDYQQAFVMVRKLFSPPVFPGPPPPGDLPLVRTSDKPTCDESELMLYIGEILFATSPSSSEGLGWTRQAVTVAEASLESPSVGKGNPKAALQERTKCKECLATGVDNWEAMLKRMALQQNGGASREGGRNGGWFEWRGWFGGGGGVKGKTLDDLGSGIFSEEMKYVETLKEKIIREGVDLQLEKTKGSTSLWIG